ncbi:MAG: cell division protein SepF [Clostridia bacterium]|nr:cell division protein SepF [Clostridia bacterium]
MDKFSRYFRGKQGNQQESDSYEFYEDSHGDEYTSRLGQYTTQSQTTTQTSSFSPMSNIMVYEPKNADDVQTVIDFLKTRESAIVNLDDVDPAVSQRILDFVSGAVYALNGRVNRIKGNIFLLSPEGVGVTGTHTKQDRR